MTPIEQAIETLEFFWRDVSMNDYAFEKLETTLAELRAQPDHSELATFLRDNSDIDDAEFCRVMLKSADALEGKV